jgi:hypothetical protein
MQLHETNRVVADHRIFALRSAQEYSRGCKMEQEYKTKDLAQDKNVEDTAHATPTNGIGQESHLPTNDAKRNKNKEKKRRKKKKKAPIKPKLQEEKKVSACFKMFFIFMFLFCFVFG